MATSTTGSDPLERFRKLEAISPFELKDKRSPNSGRMRAASRRSTRAATAVKWSR